ncbi:MAG: transposase [Actinobacteria bacterium]|nr:transposase [Actinomycetota bacterium]
MPLRPARRDSRTPSPVEAVAPESLAGLLGEFRPCFSAWTFPVFCALACGLVAQGARRTVCGMLVGARLSAVWSHHRAHRFFSHARWSPADVSATLARLIVRLLVADDEAILVAVDDTLFSRRGPKVHAAGWFHDGSAQGERKIGYGNNWVIAAIVVRLGFLDRPLALPVGFALIRKDSADASRLEAARRLVEALAAALPARRINVVADSAYAGRTLRGLPATVTWTTRLRANAALYDLAPPPTGRRGRPRTRGAKLPTLATLAGQLTFSPVSVCRYGTTTTLQVAAIACLWYGVFGPQHVTVILIRDRAKRGYDVALVTTDTTATRAQTIERYAARWSIEVAIEDAKQTVGVGQARNRVPRAVERTVPFGLLVGSLAVCWYATTGHHPDDVNTARQAAPWYRTKTQPSVLDMLVKLRRVIIAAQFRPTHPQPPTPDEINLLRLAWADAAA